MRQIKIDKALDNKVSQFCADLFVDGRRDDFEHPRTRLAKLKSIIKGHKQLKKKQYIQKIIDEYERIIKAKPEEQQQLLAEFDVILPYTDFDDTKTKQENCFYLKVVKAMRYEDLRKKDILPILGSIGLKACVYCNAQLTVVLEAKYKTGGKRRRVVDKPPKANLELDHFYPKSKYPFLCTSFYNLYPTCSNCNRAKSTKESKFQLYTEHEDLDVFRFSLSAESIGKYWISRDLNDIKIDFHAAMQTDNLLELLENHTELFCIPQVYDTQKDLAEELLHKAFVYNKSYNQELIRNYSSLFPNQAVIKRLLIGNYAEADEIHKRPMAKFTFDIAKQLKLI
tara:strand:- start:11669 stop:12685 length:1017 start_codon:yes stop_codon:yes gene_type:complete